MRLATDAWRDYLGFGQDSAAPEQTLPGLWLESFCEGLAQDWNRPPLSVAYRSPDPRAFAFSSGGFAELTSLPFLVSEEEVLKILASRRPAWSGLSFARAMSSTPELPSIASTPVLKQRPALRIEPPSETPSVQWVFKGSKRPVVQAKPAPAKAVGRWPRSAPLPSRARPSAAATTTRIVGTGRWLESYNQPDLRDFSYEDFERGETPLDPLIEDFPISLESTLASDVPWVPDAPTFRAPSLFLSSESSIRRRAAGAPKEEALPVLRSRDESSPASMAETSGDGEETRFAQFGPKPGGQPLAGRPEGASTFQKSTHAASLAELDHRAELKPLVGPAQPIPNAEAWSYTPPPWSEALLEPRFSRSTVTESSLPIEQILISESRFPFERPLGKRSGWVARRADSDAPERVAETPDKTSKAPFAEAMAHELVPLLDPDPFQEMPSLDTVGWPEDTIASLPFGSKDLRPAWSDAGSSPFERTIVEPSQQGVGTGAEVHYPLYTEAGRDTTPFQKNHGRGLTRDSVLSESLPVLSLEAREKPETALLEGTEPFERIEGTLFKEDLPRVSLRAPEREVSTPDDVLFTSGTGVDGGAGAQTAAPSWLRFEEPSPTAHISPQSPYALDLDSEKLELISGAEPLATWVDDGRKIPSRSGTERSLATSLSSMISAPAGLLELEAERPWESSSLVADSDEGSVSVTAPVADASPEYIVKTDGYMGVADADERPVRSRSELSAVRPEIESTLESGIQDGTLLSGAVESNEEKLESFQPETTQVESTVSPVSEGVVPSADRAIAAEAPEAPLAAGVDKAGGVDAALPSRVVSSEAARAVVRPPSIISDWKRLELDPSEQLLLRRETTKAKTPAGASIALRSPLRSLSGESPLLSGSEPPVTVSFPEEKRSSSSALPTASSVLSGGKGFETQSLASKKPEAHRAAQAPSLSSGAKLDFRPSFDTGSELSNAPSETGSEPLAEAGPAHETPEVAAPSVRPENLAADAPLELMSILLWSQPEGLSEEATEPQFSGLFARLSDRASSDTGMSISDLPQLETVFETAPTSASPERDQAPDEPGSVKPREVGRARAARHTKGFWSQLESDFVPTILRGPRRGEPLSVAGEQPRELRWPESGGQDQARESGATISQPAFDRATELSGRSIEETYLGAPLEGRPDLEPSADQSIRRPSFDQSAEEAIVTPARASRDSGLGWQNLARSLSGLAEAGVLRDTRAMDSGLETEALPGVLPTRSASEKQLEQDFSSRKLPTSDSALVKREDADRGPREARPSAPSAGQRDRRPIFEGPRQTFLSSARDEETAAEAVHRKSSGAGYSPMIRVPAETFQLVREAAQEAWSPYAEERASAAPSVMEPDVFDGDSFLRDASFGEENFLSMPGADRADRPRPREIWSGKPAGPTVWLSPTISSQWAARGYPLFHEGGSALRRTSSIDRVFEKLVQKFETPQLTALRAPSSSPSSLAAASRGTSLPSRQVEAQESSRDELAFDSSAEMLSLEVDRGASRSRPLAAEAPERKVLRRKVAPAPTSDGAPALPASWPSELLSRGSTLTGSAFRLLRQQAQQPAALTEADFKGSVAVKPLQAMMGAQAPLPSDAAGRAEGVFMAPPDREAPGHPDESEPSADSTQDLHVRGMDQVVSELRWRMRLEERWDAELD